MNTSSKSPTEHTSFDDVDAAREHAERRRQFMAINRRSESIKEDKP